MKHTVCSCAVRPVLGMVVSVALLGVDPAHPRAGAEGGDPVATQPDSNAARMLDDLGQTLDCFERPQRSFLIDMLAAIALDPPSPDVARKLVDFADELRQRDEYELAELLAQQAVAESRRLVGSNHADTARALNTLAVTQARRGNPVQAHGTATEAIRILEQLCAAPDADCQSLLADCLNSDGIALGKLHRYQESQARYQSALLIRSRFPGEKSREFAVILHNLAQLKILLVVTPEDLEEVKHIAQRALAIDVDVYGPRDGEVGNDLLLLAAILRRQGRPDEAEERYREALDVLTEAYGPDRLETLMARGRLALLLHTRGRFSEAEPVWQQHLESYERLRARVPKAELGRVGFDGAYDYYGCLAACLVRNGRALEAWEQLERSLARALRDSLFDAEAAAAAPTGVEKVELTAVQRQLTTDTAIVAWLDVDLNIVKQNEHWGVVLRKDSDPVWVPLPGSPEQREWTRANQDLPERVADLLSERKVAIPIPAPLRVLPDLPEGELRMRAEILHRSLVARQPLSDDDRQELLRLSAPDWRAADHDMWHGAVHDLVNSSRYLRAPDGVLQALAAQRIDPLRPHLQGVRHLVVIPTGVMARVPVEALTTDYVVSYAPSASVFALLRGRTRFSRDHLSFVGVADPPYNGDQLAAMEQEQQESRRPEIAASQRGTGLGDAQKKAILTGGPPSKAAAAALSRLRGSRVEVEAAGATFRTRKLLLGPEASEANVLAALRSDYDYVLIPVHGIADRSTPLTSALILSQVDSPAGGYDGVLHASEVLNTLGGRMHARIVVLSACESALGPNVGGEWYVGFTQAFLLAGAENVLVSLWNVEDASTAVLIMKFFAQVQHRPLADALRDAKAYLRAVTVDQLLASFAGVPEMAQMRRNWEVERMAHGGQHRPYEHPNYWAGFILVGDGGPLRPPVP